MSELKNCPFCGGKAELITSFSEYGVETGASCESCDAYCESVDKWNTRTDGWIGVDEQPKETGRYTVNSSYGVREAFFTAGFVEGDYCWQDCQTGDDEGMCNMDGVDFEVYDWMSLPKQPARK